MRSMGGITRCGTHYITSPSSPASSPPVTTRSSRQGIMTDSTPLTLIHGPTIRHGTGNASHVRSQLMRQRYREKRLRILRKNSNIDDIQINTQPCEIETQTILAGVNLRQIAPSQIDPFLPDHRKMSHYDFLLHNCGFRAMVTIK